MTDRHDCACPDEQLCDKCFGRARVAALGPARVIGECWAERVCRGEHRAREAWPTGEKPRAIALRLVAQLSRDPRMHPELAVACLAGAAAWWERRPAGYR